MVNYTIVHSLYELIVRGKWLLIVNGCINVANPMPQTIPKITLFYGSVVAPSPNCRLVVVVHILINMLEYLRII